MPSVFLGELSRTYQNDCRITASFPPHSSLLKKHCIVFKEQINFLICLDFKLYVTVDFQVTIVGFVRRCYKHRVNATTYSKMVNRNPDRRGTFFSHNNLFSLMKAELFPWFYTTFGTIFDSCIFRDSFTHENRPSFMSSGTVHK